MSRYKVTLSHHRTEITHTPRGYVFVCTCGATAGPLPRLSEALYASNRHKDHPEERSS